MIIGDEIWKELKLEIETLLKNDTQITDVIINYQVKIPKGQRHYGNIKIKTTKQNERK
jgi:hypothetical protein